MGSIKLLILVAVLMLGATGIAVAAAGEQAAPAADDVAASPGTDASDHVSAVAPATDTPAPAAAADEYGDDASMDPDSASVDDDCAAGDCMDDESMDDASMDDMSVGHEPMDATDDASGYGGAPVQQHEGGGSGDYGSGSSGAAAMDDAGSSDSGGDHRS